jgi:23S rRNA (uracil1939-C5)-methyltransferase
MNKVLQLEAERIVYISCNPSTFARDLKKLLVKYESVSLRLVDFFPQTYHIESVAFLRLK